MKITIKLILLFLIPGFLLFHGMYYIQTMSNLHNANNEISDIMRMDMFHNLLWMPEWNFI